MEEEEFEYWEIDPTDNITITVEEYHNLLDASHLLTCLMEYGIKDWDKWSAACQKFDKEKNGV